MLKGRLQQTIPEGPLAGIPIEVTWDAEAVGVTSNPRGVSTVKRFDAAIGPDRRGRTYRFEVGFDQGRARVTNLTVNAARPLTRLSIDVDELALWAVRLLATSSRAVFKINPGDQGSVRITPASRREAHSLAEHQDVGIPRQVSESFLRDVVAIYEAAIAEGKPAWAEIRDHYGVSHATVGNWLKEARKRKLLKVRAPKRPEPAKKRGKR